MMQRLLSYCTVHVNVSLLVMPSEASTGYAHEAITGNPAITDNLTNEFK